MQQQQQQQPPKKENEFYEGERLQQQHRNRRRQNTAKEAKANSKQQRKVKGKKDLLDAVEAKARIAAARAEVVGASVKYCDDECCPQVDYPDR